MTWFQCFSVSVCQKNQTPLQTNQTINLAHASRTTQRFFLRETMVQNGYPPLCSNRIWSKPENHDWKSLLDEKQHEEGLKLRGSIKGLRRAHRPDWYLEPKWLRWRLGIVLLYSAHDERLNGALEEKPKSKIQQTQFKNTSHLEKCCATPKNMSCELLHQFAWHTFGQKIWNHRASRKHTSTPKTGNAQTKTQTYTHTHAHTRAHAHNDTTT